MGGAVEAAFAAASLLARVGPTTPKPSGTTHHGYVADWFGVRTQVATIGPMSFGSVRGLYL